MIKLVELLQLYEGEELIWDERPIALLPAGEEPNVSVSYLLSTYISRYFNATP